MRKICVIGLIILLVGVNVSGNFTKENKNVSTIGFDGNNLYVGGGGPNNYTKIQDAIDNSSDGDTVFVYSGIYYEYNIEIGKSINLIGENRNTTIIDGQHNDGHIINISVDNVTVNGFKIKNCGTVHYEFSKYGGININSDGHVIINNIFENEYDGSGENWEAIMLINVNNSIISDNIFYCINDGAICPAHDPVSQTRMAYTHDNNIISNNTVYRGGIYLTGDNNIIDGNIIYGNGGVVIYGNINTTANSWDFVYNNTISYNSVIPHPDTMYIGGILLYHTSDNNIFGNYLYDGVDQHNGNTNGIYLQDVLNTEIYQNTIIGYFYGILIMDSYNITVENNDINGCTYGILFEYNDNEPVIFKINSVNNPGHNVIRNNFKKVFFPARQLFTKREYYNKIFWDENYWCRSRLFPMIIFGMIGLFDNWGVPVNIELDLHPAKQPYDIPKVAI